MFWCKFGIGCDILLNNYISPQVDNKRSRRTTRIKIGELFIILTFRYFCRSVKLLMSLAMYRNMEVVSWKTKFDILSVKRGVTKNYYMTPLRFFILFFNISTTSVKNYTTWRKRAWKYLVVEEVLHRKDGWEVERVIL